MVSSLRSRVIALVGAAGAVLALGWAGAAAVRLYRSERLLETTLQPDLERAVRLAPANSMAWARLGALLEREGDSAGAVRALEQAVRWNPYNAAALVDLALHWELAGDAARAERALLQAQRVDGGAATHWALVNFYLRQGVDERFWGAMQAALRRSRSNLDPAFALCWRASNDPNEILKKGLPDDPELHRAYFAFLAGRGQKNARPEAAGKSEQKKR